MKVQAQDLTGKVVMVGDFEEIYRIVRHYNRNYAMVSNWAQGQLGISKVAEAC